MNDNVNSPEHYRMGDIECIDAIEEAIEKLPGNEAFKVGQVIKYLWRYNWKGKPVEDLKKAQWYLERLIWQVEQKNVQHKSETDSFTIAVDAARWDSGHSDGESDRQSGADSKQSRDEAEVESGNQGGDTKEVPKMNGVYPGKPPEEPEPYEFDISVVVPLPKRYADYLLGVAKNEQNTINLLAARWLMDVIDCQEDFEEFGEPEIKYNVTIPLTPFQFKFLMGVAKEQELYLAELVSEWLSHAITARGGHLPPLNELFPE